MEVTTTYCGADRGALSLAAVVAHSLGTEFGPRQNVCPIDFGPFVRTWKAVPRTVATVLPQLKKIEIRLRACRIDDFFAPLLLQTNSLLPFHVCLKVREQSFAVLYLCSPLALRINLKTYSYSSSCRILVNNFTMRVRFDNGDVGITLDVETSMTLDDVSGIYV